MFRLLAAFFRCITVHSCSISCVLHRQNTTDERSLGVVDLFALPLAFLPHYQVVETHVYTDQTKPLTKCCSVWRRVGWKHSRMGGCRPWGRWGWYEIASSALGSLEGSGLSWPAALSAVYWTLLKREEKEVRLGSQYVALPCREDRFHFCGTMRRSTVRQGNATYCESSLRISFRRLRNYRTNTCFW